MSTAPDTGPDSEAHRLAYVVEGALLSAARNVRRGIQYSQYVGPWDDTIDLLRRGALALQQLQALGGPAADDATPCHWCGRPTTEDPGHEACRARAWQPTPAKASAPAPVAPTSAAPIPAAPVDTGTSSETSPPSDTSPKTSTTSSKTSSTRGAVRRPPVRTFFQDPATEHSDFTRAVRRIVARDEIPMPADALIGAALDAWHAAVTAKGEACRFVSSAGHTGVSAYHWLMSMHGSMTKPTALESERVDQLSRRDRSLVRSLSFVNPNVVPALGQVVTEVDVNAQYLAAARSVELGDGEPVELDQIDPADLPALLKRPGYLQLATVPDLTTAPAHLRHALPRLAVGTTLPTPIAAYLHRDHKIALDIAAAITWPAHGRRLSVWCEMFANGRATLTDAAATDPAAALALKVLKDVYSRYLGGYLRSKTHNPGPTCRTDWHDMLVAQGVANAARAIDKAVKNDGATVLGSLKDAYWLLDDDVIEPAALTFSQQPGKWKRNRVAPVTTEITEAHRIGRVGLLRQAITASDQAAKGTS